MLAANEWHKFEENYRKYGLDFQPQKSMEEFREERAAKAAARKSSTRIKPRDKIVILLLILAIGVCGVALVCLHAYESSINYHIFQLNQEAGELNGEINNLNVELNGYSNLDEIASYATKNLGMVYPETSQYEDVSMLVGRPEVDEYIAGLTAQQRGVVADSDYTLAQAAMDLFA